MNIDEKTGVSFIDLGGHEYPFDLSFKTIYNYSVKVGWEKESVDEILSRLIDHPVMAQTVELLEMAYTRGALKTKFDASKANGGLKREDMAEYYYVLFKALADSVRAWFTKNGIDTIPVDSKEPTEKKE